MLSSFFGPVAWAVLVEAFGLEMFTGAGGGPCPPYGPSVVGGAHPCLGLEMLTRCVMRKSCNVKRGVRPYERRPFFPAFKSSNGYLRPEYSR